MGAALLNTIFVLAGFAGMEGIAWLTHKYIMHGLLWVWHKDHHSRYNYGFWQRNDLFFLLFAIPGIICLLTGSVYSIQLLLFPGIGITLYGACYFLVHDVFIHQRIKLFRNSSNRYLKAIRRAHKIHHKHINKAHGECFGMLWVPLKYFFDN